MNSASSSKIAIQIWLLLALSAGSWAQVNTATIYGVVTDPSHANIPGTEIQLRNELTGAASSTKSNDGGQFTFNYVPIGRYTLSVQHPGFQRQERSGLELSAGQSLKLDLQLQLTSSAQSLTVSAEEPLLNMVSAEQHDTISSKSITELPVAKLDWTNLLSLQAGVSKAQNPGRSVGGITMNGLPPAAFGITVDGTNASLDPELPSVGFYQAFNVINTINTEAIQEVSTTKGIAPASVAGSMSGNINVITKGGTNEFHGSLFEFNSVSRLNARNQFLATKPRATFNQYGGALGGPLLRNHLFFFGDYQGVRSSSFAAVSGDVPTPEFAAQAIAAVPAYKSIFSVFPSPTASYSAGAQTARYVGARALVQNDNNAVIRLDWYATKSDSMTVRYTRLRPVKQQPSVIAVNSRITDGHSDLYNWQFTHGATSWTAVTRFGYNRLYLNRLDAGLGIGLDQISFGFNSGGAEAFQKRGSTTTWEETFARNSGRHSMQFGGIVQRQDIGRTDVNTNSFSYSSLTDFLANVPSSISLNFPLLPFRLRTYQIGGFFQDDYRILPNLTVNLGLRYDYFSVPKERDHRIFQRGTTSLGPGFGDWLPPDEMFQSDWTNFAPRLGFAWTLGASRKTVVRGGAGLFYNPHTMFATAVDLVLTDASVPFRLTLSRSQAMARGLKFPVDTNAVLDQIKQSGTPIANPVINQYFPNPYSAQWTFGIQREIGYGFLLDTSYVGSRGIHLYMRRAMNRADRLTGVVPDPRFGSFGYYDTSDRSRYNSWQTSLQKRFSRGVSFTGSYTWASNTSFGDADLINTVAPQDIYNIRADHGPTPYSVRHSFSGAFVYELPLDRLSGSDSRASKLLLRGWQISGVLTARTGLPANITDSASSYESSRPDLVSGVDPILDDYQTTRQYLNRSAFLRVPISPASGVSIRPGNLGRYALWNPGMWNFDASFAKNLLLSERMSLQLRGDFFNSLNHTNLAGLSTNINSGSFGQLTSAASRSVQLGMRFVF
jgi:hypothetical protein